MKVDDLLHPHWLAAAAGALVGLKALPGSSTLEKLCNVGAGFGIAAWMGPAAVDYLGVTSPNVGSGIVFALGACGLVVFNSLIAGLKATDLGAWATSWLPRRKGGE